ncbi:radical SAM protein [Candidatus Woesearchaeota archaeon]|nr:radical SAM protein [Candidatus Woesearchaeota archaeon]
MEAEKTKFHSWKAGNLCTGCSMCVEGKKLVLFVTGKCPNRCFYCPVSEDKFGADVVYANEWQVLDPNNPLEMLEEARLTEAMGAGITGGDPLADLKRTCKYIRILKDEFGKSFHIHLYTPLTLVTESSLKKLFDAGLDEIRFHPMVDDDKLWKRLELAKAFDWSVGVEIPCVPGKEAESKKLIDFMVDKVDFLNLNELERSDTTISHYKLDEMGFKQRNDTTYGVIGSRELGFELIKYGRSKGLPVHFCTGKLKDSVQVGNRLKRRAKNAKKTFDFVTSEGLLIRGVAYYSGLEPGFDFKKRILEANRFKVVYELSNMKSELLKSYDLKEEDIFLDELHLRLCMSTELCEDLCEDLKALGLVPALVEEYPTVDAFSVEVEFL